jgi:hypothetical protein
MQRPVLLSDSSSSSSAVVTELGCASPDDRARPGKNGIRKTGLGKRDSEKWDSEKTGFGLQADRARPGKNWIIFVCALQLQLQSYKRVYVCPELTCLTCFCL